MKDLQTLERELAYIEEDLRKIEARVGRVSMELGQLREAEAPASLDFEDIRRCAGKLPFRSHPLAGNADAETAGAYLRAILGLLCCQEGNAPDLLVFAQWLLGQSVLERSLPDLLVDASGAVREEDFARLKGMSSTLLLDLMVAASLMPPGEKALRYVMEAAQRFGVPEKRFEKLALLARCALRQSLDGLSEEQKQVVLKSRKWETYYLPSSFWQGREHRSSGNQPQGTQKATKIFPRAASKSDNTTFPRKIIFHGRKSDYFRLKWFAHTHEDVKADEWVGIAEHKNREQEWIPATAPGVFFLVTDRGEDYAVLSSKDDSLKGVREWILSKKRKGEI